MRSKKSKNIYKWAVILFSILIIICIFCLIDYDKLVFSQKETKAECSEEKADCCQIVCPPPCEPPPCLPSPLPECDCSRSGLYVTGAFLYWQPIEDSLEYGWKLSVPKPTNALLKITEHKFDWEPGFRAGAGYRLPYDRWDAYLNWTHLSANNKQLTLANGAQTVFNLESNSPPPFFASDSPAFSSHQASSYMHLSFNTLDLELGREWPLSCSFLVRPHFGIRGVSINQIRKIHYGPIIRFNDDLGPGIPDIKQTNKFLAAGPRFGGNGNWKLGKGFSLVGQLSATLVYGRFKTQSELFITSPTPFSFILASKIHRLRPNLQMLFGADWEVDFCNGRQFHLSAGYELQYWWKQFLVVSVSEIHHPDGDLMFQGLTLDAGFGF